MKALEVGSQERLELMVPWLGDPDGWAPYGKNRGEMKPKSDISILNKWYQKGHI